MLPFGEAWTGSVIHKRSDTLGNIAEIASNHITRLKSLLNAPDTRASEAFAAFLEELQDDLNESVSREDAIEMLAQHLITRPVFQTLFEGHQFTSENPVSRAMQRVLDILDEANLDKESEDLDKFYADVQRRAKGITDPAAKQNLIKELYEKFFKKAFPRTTDKFGIVYTPPEIVDFIIHSVNDVLQTEFGQTLGSEGVHIMDPFTGTGTFITRLLQSGLIAPEEMEHKFRHEIHANEIVLLAYYIAAINIEAVYHGLQGGDYVPFEGICLTDTFQMYESDDLISHYMPDNSERRKRQKATDIRVILGNPPYSKGQDSANDDNANVDYPSLDGRIRDTYAALTDAQNKNGLYNSYLRAFRWASDRIGDDGGVVAFVTNGGWLDGNATTGVRRSFANEFSDLYIFNLRGDAHLTGERRRKEKGNVFGAGTRTPVAISVLVRNPDAAHRGRIHYRDIGDYLEEKEKLSIIRDFGSTRGIAEADGWTRIEPDEHGDWLNQRDASFDQFIKIGDKKDKTAETLFETYSAGVKTQRDAWCYNRSRADLERNIGAMIDTYNDELTKARQAEDAGQSAPKLLGDPRQISWSAGLQTALERGRHLDLSSGEFVQSIYRPFGKEWLYYSAELNERRYQMPRIFPDSNSPNRVIAMSSPGARGSVSALMTDCIPSLHAADMSGSQCFPLYIYDDADTGADDLFSGADHAARRDGITDAGLRHFQAAYPGQEITREDIFYYTYGLLHSEEYRARYADNLTKELPRIPCVKKFEDFRAFAQAGRDLADLHVGYEAIEPYPVTFKQGHPDTWVFDDPQAFYRVTKMKFSGKRPNLDKSTVIYNANITMQDIPLEAYDYVVNGKPALEWVMERQAVLKDSYNPKTKKGSDIVNDANRYANETVGNPAYPLELFQRVITVSLRTMEIVRGLPKLEIDE